MRKCINNTLKLLSISHAGTYGEKIILSTSTFVLTEFRKMCKLLGLEELSEFQFDDCSARLSFFHHVAV